MNRKSEKWLESELVKRVKEIGGLCIKFTPTSEAGYPDRIILKNKMTLFAEIKTKGKRPRKLQLERFKELELQGFNVFVIDSEEKIKKIIELIK